MLQTVNRIIDRAAEWTVAILFMGLVLTGGLQVFCRFALNYPLPWSEEVQIFGHVWIVFLTIPIAYNRGSHILMNILLERLPLSVQRAIAIAVDIMWLWIGGSIVIFSMRLVRVAAFQLSPALEIPMSYIYTGLVIGGGYLTLVAVRKLVAHTRGANGAPAAAVEDPL
ncbi:MAG: TRAP transporter small permease [Candidatus Binataceae bacterium]